MNRYLIIAIMYTVMSVITFLVYAWDKRSAVKGKWRVPEAKLHLLELLGGWPGGFLAQRFIRHKNRKLSFQIVFWFILIIHLAAWAYILFVLKPTWMQA